MGPFDMSNLGALLGGLPQRLQEMRERAANARFTGEAGGGMVRVVVTGEYQVDSVSIAEGAMQDREMLEDLVRAALAEALRKTRDDMANNLQQLTGGLPLPPGLFPM